MSHVPYYLASVLFGPLPPPPSLEASCPRFPLTHEGPSWVRINAHYWPLALCLRSFSCSPTCPRAIVTCVAWLAYCSSTRGLLTSLPPTPACTDQVTLQHTITTSLPLQAPPPPALNTWVYGVAHCLPVTQPLTCGGALRLPTVLWPVCGTLPWAVPSGWVVLQQSGSVGQHSQTWQHVWVPPASSPFEADP